MKDASNFLRFASRNLKSSMPTRKTSIKFSVITGAILNVLVFYPGFMSPDSLNQFQQASTNVYSDWHPPIMAWVWRQLNYVFVPPSGLLFLQIALLWWAVYLLALEFISSKLKFGVLLLLPFFPSILSISGVLWKDVQMAFALLTVFALSYVKQRGSTIFLIVLLLLYATSLRSNAIFAIPPLFFFVLISRLSLVSKVKVLAITLIATIALLGASNLIVQSLTHPTKANLASVALQDDLAYFSLIKGKSLIPTVPISDIRKCAQATPGGSPMYVIDVCLASLANREANSPLIYTKELRIVWLENVIQNPYQYLRFRLYGFNVQLRAPGVTPRYFWNEGIVENEFGFKPLNGPLTSLARDVVNFFGKNIDAVFKPFFWAWLNLLVTFFLLLAKNSRKRNALLYFNLSGVSYLFSYFFVNASDYRYSYWMTVITIFVFVTAVLEYGVKLFSFPKEKRILFQLLILIVTLLSFGWTSFFNIDLSELVK